MYLFRIHIRPGGGSVSMEETFDYCLKNKLLGVGWRVDIPNTKDWDTYYAAASKVHDKLNACAYIKKWVSAGDLVWTRNTSGEYFLACVVSGWEYWTCNESCEKDIDIANIIRCDIRPVAIDAVPGKVVACFRASLSIQEIASLPAIEYSKFLWNTITGTAAYEIDRVSSGDIFMLMDDEETEDVVFLYLQSKGWHVLPNSRKKDTMAFEYLVVRPDTGEFRAVQVKTGGSGINRNDYAQLPMGVFLFQSADLYWGEKHRNVTAIPSEEIRKFLRPENKALPSTVRGKLKMSAQCSLETRDAH